MNLKTLREEQCRLMAQRIAAIGRIRHGLHYTLSHLTLPIETTENLGDANLEALAAFNERFGKLQDVIAAAMKQGSSPIWRRCGNISASPVVYEQMRCYRGY